MSGNRLKKDVQQWVEQPEVNFGWLLIGDERTPQTVVAFASRAAAFCNATPTGLLPPVVEVA